MSAYKSIVALCLITLCVVQARELQADVNISNCATYGMVNGKRVCTRCKDDHVLVPGGLECQRRISGCKDVIFEGGKQVCKTCKDDHVLIPGGKSCERKVVGH